MLGLLYGIDRQPIQDNLERLKEIFIQAILNYDDAELPGDICPDDALEQFGVMLAYLTGEDIVGEDDFRKRFVKTYSILRKKKGYWITEDYAHESCPWFDFTLKGPKSIINTLGDVMAQQSLLQDEAMARYAENAACQPGYLEQA